MAEETNNSDVAGLDIDWLKTIAGALAAVTTAVLLSTLGAVGTLIGAALGSVAATVGSAIYAQGLARSKRAVLKAQETALNKVGAAQAEVRRAARRQDEGQDTAAQAHLDAADEQLEEAQEELGPNDDGDGDGEQRGRFAALPWKRIALLAAGTFVVVMLAITGFEKIAGQPVSNLTGGSDSQGTTFGGVTGGSSNDGGNDGNGGNGGNGGGGDQQPSIEQSETSEPTSEPTETPSETPSASVTPSATPTPTPTPSTAPTPTPTPSQAPSQAPSASPSASP